MQKYSTVASIYTWGDLLPLLANKKSPVPRGYTGLHGKSVDDADRAMWANHDGNFALRMPENVVALDVDHYDDKHGADELKRLEEEYGKLPETYMSSGRENYHESAQYFFRYSGGKLNGKAGTDIDILQRSHRYAAVWPSEVHDDKADRVYKWYGPDGAPCGIPPLIEELAELPEAWENMLRAGASGYDAERADSSTSATFETAMAADDRLPCTEVQNTVRHWLKRFDEISEGSHHDTMLAAVHAVVGSCSKGHPGFTYGVDELRKAWMSAGLGDSRDSEFERLVEGAVAKRASERVEYKLIVGAAHSCENTPTALPTAVREGRIVKSVPIGVSDAAIVEEDDEDLAVLPEDFYEDPENLGVIEGEEEIDTSWVDLLIRDEKGAIQKSYANTQSIMENDETLKGVGINRMGGGVAWRKMPAWRRNSADPFKRVDINMDDADYDRCYAILREYFGGLHSSLPQEACKEALMIYASNNTFSPWVDYLDSLPKWDGVERISECIPTAVSTEYSRQALLNFFLGLMHRAYSPGCQLDSMLVLWGPQGVRKTSWFKSIVPHEIFYKELDTIPDSSKMKDELAACHKSAIVLLDELDKLRRRDEQSALKAFITGRDDTWRAPYGRVNVTHARQFVLGGTTNEEEFLLDATGNRRYWPIEVTDTIPDEYLTREFMDMLLSEARDRYVAGERVVYGSDFEVLAEAERSRNFHDPIGDAIEAWLDDPSGGMPVLGGTSIDVSRVSIGLLIDYVPELRNIDRLRDKMNVDRIAAAMDRNPNYVRRERPARVPAVGGKSTKKWWERI